MYFALYNGGPRTYLISFIVVFCGAISQAASIGEMASIQPVAGAQYHWTYHLAPANVKRFATWLQGWSTWFGYVSIVAGMANVTMIQLQSMVELNNPSYVAGGWKTSVLVIAMGILLGGLNVWGFQLIPWIEMIAGVLHVCLFVVFAVVLGVLGTRNEASFWLSTNISSGWDNHTFIASNVGMLTCVWSFTGFDGAIHMSEETRKAKSAVPRAMFWSIFINGCLGFVMVNVLISAMESVEDIVNTVNPVLKILMDATGSKSVTTAMISGFSVIAFSCNIANIAGVSRLTWAWARDGGLPAYFAYVDPKQRVPIRAVWLTVFIACALCLLNIGSTAYVAFGALTSLSSISLYLSYAIAISSMLYARYAGTAKLGEWNLGRYGVYVNSFALLYTLYVMIFLPFPSELPVTGANMNYCGPVMVAVLVMTLVLWFMRARKHWSGPNLHILDFVLAHS